MNDNLKTEEEYREALRKFIEMLDCKDDSHDCVTLFELIRKLQIYEQENCT